MSVTLTYKGLSSSGKIALYKGLRTVTRLSVTDFPENKPVPSFTVDGAFAGPRVIETKEARKARIAALPKPTLAEKIAKRKAALAKLEAQAAAETQASA